MSISYDKYLMLCKKAVEEDFTFAKFRSHPRCTHMVETVRFHQGEKLIAEIQKTCPKLIKSIKKIAADDKIAGPTLCHYSEIKATIAPTTLRYIKIVGDLLSEFGTLDTLDIVEIGVGYGGQCKVIHDYCKPKSYTLIDHPDVLNLSAKYLSNFGVTPILRKIKDIRATVYDLCISNYAFTEIDRRYQNYYVQRILKYANKGYIACNIFGDGSSEQQLTKEQIAALKPNSKFIPEEPLTGPQNIIYIWN